MMYELLCAMNKSNVSQYNKMKIIRGNMKMTYTTCEICGTDQYCFMQFRTDIQQDDTTLIKKAACTHCLTVVYKTMMTHKPVQTIPYYC